MTHPHMLLHILVRWLDFIALVTFLGGLSYTYFVWKPLSHRFKGGNGLAALIGGALIILAAAGLADLALRAMMMSGRPFTELPSVLPVVLEKTRFGVVWIAKFGLILFLGVVWLLGKRGLLSGGVVKVLSLSCGAAVGLMSALSGHAADQGIWSGTVLFDWIHLLVVSGWVGGLFAFQLHLRPSLAGVPEAGRKELLAAALRRFSAVAMTAVGAMLLSGGYNTWVHVHSTTLLATTDYGKILILKWLLIVPMVLLGGMNRFYGLPILENRDDRGLAGLLARTARAVIEGIWSRPQKMGRLCFQMLLIEAVLGLGVLGCSAWITQLAPPHEPGVGFERSHHDMGDMGM
jgi:putative copper export protein